MKASTSSIASITCHKWVPSKQCANLSYQEAAKVCESFKCSVCTKCKDKDGKVW